MRAYSCLTSLGFPMANAALGKFPRPKSSWVVLIVVENSLSRVYRAAATECITYHVISNFLFKVKLKGFGYFDLAYVIYTTQRNCFLGDVTEISRCSNIKYHVLLSEHQLLVSNINFDMFDILRSYQKQLFFKTNKYQGCKYRGCF